MMSQSLAGSVQTQGIFQGKPCPNDPTSFRGWLTARCDNVKEDIQGSCVGLLWRQCVCFPSPAWFMVYLSPCSQWFQLFLSLFPGPGAPTTLQQRANCMSQLECLLSGMRSALLTVTQLKLRVVFLQDNFIQTPYHSLSDNDLSQMTCSAALGVVAGAVFETLAEAVPALTELQLRGCCWDAATDAFGEFCPLLATLDVQALHVPIIALRSVSKQLPNLSSLRVRNKLASSSCELSLSTYINAVCRAVKYCNRLARLQIILNHGMKISCKNWGLLPASLTHLHLICECDINFRPVSMDQLSFGVQELSLETVPFKKLAALVSRFPNLTSLTSSWSKKLLQLSCPDEDNHKALALLKDTFLIKKLQLNLPQLFISGTCAEIQALLLWMPVNSSIIKVHLELKDNGRLTCLNYLARVFPEISILVLDWEVVDWEDWSLDVEDFKPLAAHLDNLHLPSELPLTTDLLLELSRVLENLSLCEYQESEDVDHHFLQDVMWKMGRNVQFLCDASDDLDD